MSLRKAVIRAGFETLYFSGAHRIARPFFAGLGAILTFHRVVPASKLPFQPNRLLEITPAFLDDVLTAIRADGVEIVTMDEACRRIATRSGNRFVALTFDDGYRDTREHALPVLEKHEAPFTMYVPSAFPDGAGELWWVALEEAIARYDSIEVTIDGAERIFDCATTDAKNATFASLYAYLRSRETWDEMLATVREITFGYGIDTARQCRQLCLDWDGVKAVAAHPLATIGAHTVTHPILAKMNEADARREMAEGAARLTEMLGERPAHFSYPVGSPDAAGRREFQIAADLGFRSAVTTRPGMLHADHARHLTALPRISVNGEFQERRYIDVLLSGAATALANGFRRVDAA